MDHDGFFHSNDPEKIDDAALKYRVKKLGIKTYSEVMIRDAVGRPLASVIFMWKKALDHDTSLIEAMKNFINQQRRLL